MRFDKKMKKKKHNSLFKIIIIIQIKYVDVLSLLVIACNPLKRVSTKFHMTVSL